MAEFTKHAPGTFCWVDLATSDRAGAKKFYGGLFGWTFDDLPAGPDMSYTLSKLSGADVGGMGDLMDDQKKMGIPPHWMSYVAVENAEAAAQKAASLGGHIIAPVFDVMDKGRMAVIADPGGAVFSVWESRTHHGVGRRDEPNTLCWNELAAAKPDAQGAFYTNLFGWKTDQMKGGGNMPYTILLAGETGVGGMYGLTPEMGPIPSHWMPYFAVADLGASTARASSLGATTIMGATEVPNMGSFVILKDPQGAHFSLWKPANA